MSAESKSTIDAFESWWYRGGKFPSPDERRTLKQLAAGNEATGDAIFWRLIDLNINSSVELEMLSGEQSRFLAGLEDASRRGSQLSRAFLFNNLVLGGKLSGNHAIVWAGQFGLQFLSDLDCSQAQIFLSRLLCQTGVPDARNFAVAQSLARRAIANGNLKGWAALAQAQSATGELAAARDSLLSGANAGDGDAALILAKDYLKAAGEEVKADALLRTAADRKIIEAEILLSNILLNSAKSASVQEGFAILSQASQRSCVARLSLAMVHAEGKFGHPVNLDEAMRILLTLSKYKYAPADRTLGLAYRDGASWLPKDLERAAFHLNRAACYGDAEAKRAFEAMGIEGKIRNPYGDLIYKPGN